jgi:hypothetical protein
MQVQTRKRAFTEGDARLKQQIDSVRITINLKFTVKTLFAHILIILHTTYLAFQINGDWDTEQNQTLCHAIQLFYYICSLLGIYFVELERLNSVFLTPLIFNTIIIPLFSPLQDFKWLLLHFIAFLGYKGNTVACMIFDANDSTMPTILQMLALYPFHLNPVQMMLSALIAHALFKTWYSYMSFGIQWQVWSVPYRQGLIYHKYGNQMTIYHAQ